MASTDQDLVEVPYFNQSLDLEPNGPLAYFDNLSIKFVRLKGPGPDGLRQSPKWDELEVDQSRLIKSDW